MIAINHIRTTLFVLGFLGLLAALGFSASYRLDARGEPGGIRKVETHTTSLGMPPYPWWTRQVVTTTNADNGVNMTYRSGIHPFAPSAWIGLAGIACLLVGARLKPRSKAKNKRPDLAAEVA